MRRVVIVIKRVGDGQYQAQLRLAAGGNLLFYSRREQKTSTAKRAAEQLFGPLDWMMPPERLQASEPEVSSVAYCNF